MVLNLGGIESAAIPPLHSPATPYLPNLAWELSPPPSLRLLDEGMVLVCYLPAPLLNRLQLLSPL